MTLSTIRDHERPTRFSRWKTDKKAPLSCYIYVLWYIRLNDDIGNAKEGGVGDGMEDEKREKRRGRTENDREE